MRPAEPAVSAVTVTYSGRAHMCTVVAKAALTAGAHRVVIVDNGSAENSRSLLREFAACHIDEVTLISMGSNAGSAAGYAKGIVAALEAPEVSDVWLLDDDNEPAHDALAVLLTRRAELADSRNVGIAAFRPDREYQRAVVEGSAARAFPPPGAFLHFHLSHFVKVRLTRRLGTRRACSGAPLLEYTAYGGLLLPRRVIEVAGLPDSRLFLYEDDAEYTARIRAMGGRLHLAPDARINELEASWPAHARGASGPARLLNAASRKRVFYSVRNRVYFESRYRAGRPRVRAFNKFLVITVLKSLARTPEQRAHLQDVLRAIADGEAQRLGKVTMKRADDGVTS